MSGIRPINGMGEGSKVEKCERCGVDAKGRTLHLVFPPLVSRLWVCDDCFMVGRR